MFALGLNVLTSEMGQQPHSVPVTVAGERLVSRAVFLRSQQGTGAPRHSDGLILSSPPSLEPAGWVGQ